MHRVSRVVLFVAALSVALPAAFGQGYSDSTTNHHFQLKRYEASQKSERDAAAISLVDQIKRNSATSASSDAGGSGPAGPGSFVAKAAGIAVAVMTLALLQDLFLPGPKPVAERVPVGARLDPSVERWLQDPRNRPGEPFRYDTPDGKIAKVCIRPFPGAQKVIYRWDVPGELPRETVIQETPTREHMQFMHPTATGMFIFVTQPAPDHQPSDRIHWLAAHRVGATGCAHAQAYQIAYHKFGGTPEFESVAHAPRVRQEEPVENLPLFMRTCQAQHGQAACVCLAFPLMRAIPDLPGREYRREEIRAVLQGRPDLAADIARRCRLQF